MSSRALMMPCNPPDHLVVVDDQYPDRSIHYSPAIKETSFRH
jgi:hypothetical protein